MRILLIILSMIIYVILGITFQKLKIIEHPAMWACYGSFYGYIIAYILLFKKK